MSGFLFVFVLKVGCTLSANVEHGIKYCPISLVKSDLKERKKNTRHGSDSKLRETLEHILREEEEWQQLVMYRRDFRFYRNEGDELAYKLEMDRTIIDMLHCPMRMHEKILTLLYKELLNGKTKCEVQTVRRSKSYLPPLFGVNALGALVSKEFQIDESTTTVFHGTVHRFEDDANGGLYKILYEDGDMEDFDCEEYCNAHELAASRNTQSDQTSDAKDSLFRTNNATGLDMLTGIIRTLGGLGPTWTHKWSDTNSKALQNIKLPYDQSKKIFKVSQLCSLHLAVDIAVDETKAELRKDWKFFLTEYVGAIAYLTRSTDFEPSDMDKLEAHIDAAYTTLIAIAGMEGVTNYFHYLGSGHIMWMTRLHGNLWRFRNEGVEGLNGTLSLRYNKFNNKGGNKGSSKDQINKPNGKCWAFEVLGSWMARLCMWQLGLGMKLFEDDVTLEADMKVVLWRTGRRIKYVQPQLGECTDLTLPQNVDDYLSDGCITDVEDQSSAYNSDDTNSDYNYD